MNNHKKLLGLSLIFIFSFALTACSKPDQSVDEQVIEEAVTDTDLPSIDFDKITLDNGLDVIFHIDRSDPVVAINLAVHVGSAREKVGKTGFAHLFEHLLFLDSENLGYGGLDEMNTRIGGEGTNGFTTTDMTQYFQAVPKDALEKIIWAEADKLGWFINTVNQNVIDREKQVVKNEKRQRVDNRPYGHNFYVIGKAIYPEGHPYNHQVIGSLEDLQNATLEDTKEFFAKWYKPDNVTVTLTGDFDIQQATELVKKYFGEIPAGSEPTPKTEAEQVSLTETQLFVHEDNFATLPLLTMVWPTVPEYHPDSYALNVLASYLTDGKRAPMNEVLIDEKALTTSVDGFNYHKELAGEFYLFINSKPEQDIDNLIPAIWEGFSRFEANGIPEDALSRIKTQAEVATFSGLQSVLGKAIALGEYNVFTGDPGFLQKDLQQLKAVTKEDVLRVYNTYIKDKAYIATSFVPKGQFELGIEGAQVAQVVEEVVVQGAEGEVPYDPTARIFEPTPSSFDRSIEPAFGESFELPAPIILRSSAANGLNIVGMQSNEVPLIEFSLAFDAGKIRSPLDKPGLASLTGDMLTKGAGELDVAAFEEALGELGSRLSAQTSSQHTYIRGTTLARNLGATLELLQDMILSPQFSEDEFNLLKDQYIQQSVAQQANPDAIAQRELLKLVYAEQTPLATYASGSEEQIQSISLDDVKAFHAKHYSLSNATLNIVGDFDMEVVSELFGSLTSITNEALPKVAFPTLAEVSESKIHFFDVPESKQSVLRFRRPALSIKDKDFAKLEALNFPLGGIYTSTLMTELRVNRGYTYGIRSSVFGNAESGQFGVGTSVRTNVTKESIELIAQLLSAHGSSMDEPTLAQTKDALLRGQALKNETLNDKLNLVVEMSQYGLADDVQSQNMKQIQAMTMEEAQNLISSHINPDAMHIIVVGDAKSQLESLKEVGFGEPILLNPET